MGLNSGFVFEQVILQEELAELKAQHTALCEAQLGVSRWSVGGAETASTPFPGIMCVPSSSEDELKSSSSASAEAEPLALFGDGQSSSDEGLIGSLTCAMALETVVPQCMWTIPHSEREGRLTAENTRRKAMMRHFRAVYGDNASYWAIFRDLHAASATMWERKPHCHSVLRLTGRARFYF